MSEAFWHIKNCQLFQQLTHDQLAWLEARSRTRQFPGKSPIYLPADASDGVFLLASGRAKLCHITPEGKQSILSFVEPGELFGELALMDPGEREEYAEAVVKTQVVLISGNAFRELMLQAPQLTLGITKLIGLRRRRIERRLKNLLFHSNRDRLTHLLLELADQYGVPETSGLRLGIKLSHQDLASVIGSTRETVTVVLGELQAEGLVTVGRRQITLLDVDRLADSVQAQRPRPPESKPSPPNNAFLRAEV